MKISLIHYAAPPVVGGVETVLARQAELLARAGHTVQILAGRGETWDARCPVILLPRLDSRNPHILKAKASLDAGILPEGFDRLVDQVLAELRRSLGGSEVIIAHNVASLHKNLALTAALRILTQEAGAPRVILWHHDLAWTAPRYQEELHPGYPWDLLRTAWPKAKQVTISEARRQELAQLMGLAPEVITVVPAGLDMGEFLNLQPRTLALFNSLNLYQAAPILLTPVRLTRRKNLELAIMSLAALRRELPQAALIITGPPGAHNPANLEYFEQLKALRAQLGVKNAVHLLAEQVPDGLPAACVADLFRLADALLLTSREEGFGIPILEAGLARLPIFCSDLPSLRALAGSQAVYFLPDANPLEVAGTIVDHLRGDPIYQLRVRVRQEYTWEGIYRRQIEPLLH